MTNFWKIVNKVIAESDVILEVLDARLVDETRNIEIENKIKKKNKKIIYVINKCDLVDKELMDKRKKELDHCIFVSALEHLGTTMLKKKILHLGQKDKIIVGVLGYPNTGKSSIINALSGSSKARTSSVSGYTVGIQKIKASNRIYLLDTPGVIPFEEDDNFKHAVIAAIDPSKINEPDMIAMQLLEYLDGTIERFYEIEVLEDYEETIENIAKKFNKLKKGGVPDVDQASRMIIKDWQSGKIKLKKI
jgi:ribosome biogenesis GTPase A